MKRKRSGILTKILLIALLVYAATALISMSGKITAAIKNQEDMEQKVQELEAENSELQYAIENADDEDVIEDIARGELGLVYPGERVFVGD